MQIARKDPDGARLLKKFSMPRHPTKADARTRIRPEDDPDDAARLYAYNRQDVVAEASIAAVCPDLEGEELEFYLCDAEMNARGVQVDVPMIDACIVIVKGVLAKYDAELHTLTSGAVEKASQVARLVAWLHTQGVHTDSLDEEHLDALLKTELPPAAHRALELRAAAGSASVKKVFAMRNRVTSAGRLHDLFAYHGARTGRVTGMGPQPTNLPREGPPVHACPACHEYYGAALPRCPWCNMPTLPGKAPDDWCAGAVESALKTIATGSVELVEMFFGAALETVAGCLRGLFIAAPGHDLICSDYHSIEAVVAACGAGEQWRIDVFKTHGKIYEMGASKITGIPFDEILDYRVRTKKHHPARQGIGKVSELASAYQGWIGSWKAFGADAFMSDEEIKQGVLAWRDASPAIVHMWGGQAPGNFYGLEGCAIAAVMQPGAVLQVYRLDGQPANTSFQMREDVLYMRLPSGREIAYHRPRIERQERYQRESWALSFEGWNTNPLNGPVNRWIRMRTWGGRLFENWCQAVARDVLRRAIVSLEAAGYAVVMQVYDEIIAEIPQGQGSIEEFESIMARTIEWCVGWPIKASDGWRGHRYRKG